MNYPMVRSLILTMPLASPKLYAQHLECVYHTDADQCDQSCHSAHSSADAKSAANTKLPLLEELLDLAARADFDTNLGSESGVDVLGMFTQYLLRIHCLESLEFVLAIMNFVLEPDREAWEAIYEMFIHQNSPRELNIPASIKKDLTKYLSDGYPDVNSLLRCKKFVYDDMLINLYHEFIKEIKASFVGDGDGHVILHRKLVRAGVEYSDIIQMDLGRGPGLYSTENNTLTDIDTSDDEADENHNDNDSDGSREDDEEDDEDSSIAGRSKYQPADLDPIPEPKEPKSRSMSVLSRGKSIVTSKAREIDADADSKSSEHQSASYSNEVCTLVSLIRKRVSLRPFRNKRFRTWCRWPDECDDHDMH